MSLQGNLSIERMCQLAQVSRAGFYRSLQESQPVKEEMEVRSAIQRIALEHRRRYGYRRVTAELRRRGMIVNHKRVSRVMREDNLLAVQPRAFVVTTDCKHELEVYLNLASRMKLTGINQLWVADITYIRLKTEFVYLAVILDGFSRKVVGWALERTLATRLAKAALAQAIAERQPPPGLVHHSDRGVQYASDEYVKVLQQHQMIPSMSRPANPYDNASCESFMKTLKVRRYMPTTIRISITYGRTSRRSSNNTIIAAACTRRSVTNHRRSSSRVLSRQQLPPERL
jgi:putative transposase